MQPAKRLIIVRHGNTFRPGETPTRVGAKTDLPLVEEGRARAVGKYLLAKGWIPDRTFAAPLQRTMQTARLAIEELHLRQSVTPLNAFTEIDYGVDENKTEDEVRERLGRHYLQQEEKWQPDTPVDKIRERGDEALALWNSLAVVPAGWKADTDTIIQTWKETADQIANHETVMIVSSNGIIRFAPAILNDDTEFCTRHDIKVVTGGVSVFEYDPENGWRCTVWNEKAYKLF